MYAQIRDLLNAQPFQPFVIRTSDGRDYTVRHPEMAALTRGSVFVAIGGDREQGAEEFVRISLLHVTAVSSREPSGSNS